MAGYLTNVLRTAEELPAGRFHHSRPVLSRRSPWLPKSCQPDAFITPGQFFPEDLPDCRRAASRTLSSLPASSFQKISLTAEELPAGRFHHSRPVLSRRSPWLPKSCQPDAFITPGQFFPQDLPDCRRAASRTLSSFPASSFQKISLTAEVLSECRRLPRLVLSAQGPPDCRRPSWIPSSFPASTFLWKRCAWTRFFFSLDLLLHGLSGVLISVPQTDEWNSFLDTAVSPSEQPPGLLVQV